MESRGSVWCCKFTTFIGKINCDLKFQMQNESSKINLWYHLVYTKSIDPFLLLSAQNEQRKWHFFVSFRSQDMCKFTYKPRWLIHSSYFICNFSLFSFYNIFLQLVSYFNEYHFVVFNFIRYCLLKKRIRKSEFFSRFTQRNGI